jgi:hypothetical protein
MQQDKITCVQLAVTTPRRLGFNKDGESHKVMGSVPGEDLSLSFVLFRLRSADLFIHSFTVFEARHCINFPVGGQPVYAQIPVGVKLPQLENDTFTTRKFVSFSFLVSNLILC